MYIGDSTAITAPTPTPKPSETPILTPVGEGRHCKDGLCCQTTPTWLDEWFVMNLPSGDGCQVALYCARIILPSTLAGNVQRLPETNIREPCPAAPDAIVGIRPHCRGCQPSRHSLLPGLFLDSQMELLGPLPALLSAFLRPQAGE